MSQAQTKELKNAIHIPRRFYARHMFPGVCGYDDEVVLVDNDAMKRMIPSMEGVPIYINHRPVDLEKIQSEADGYVVKCFYNELDGWLWAECLAVSDEAQAAIDNGWKVSNAYSPTEWGPAGKFHNVDYQRKVVNGEFKHLAIVENPRYEEADIFTPEQYQNYELRKTSELKELQNSLETKTNGAKMFKLFKNKREEVSEIDADTMITLENGKSVSVQEMINAVKKNEEDQEKAKAEKEKADKDNSDDEEKMNEDTEVSVGDKKMPLKELVNKYNKMKNNASKKNKKNAEEDDDDMSDENENEAEEESDEDKKDKKNSKTDHFTELQNAHHKKPTNKAAVIEISSDQLARGLAQYGSQKTAK